MQISRTTSNVFYVKKTLPFQLITKIAFNHKIKIVFKINLTVLIINKLLKAMVKYIHFVSNALFLAILA